MKRKRFLRVAAVLLVFVLLLSLLTMLLSPKYAETLVEGSFISQYYGEAGGHDVIFIGDCEVYANFSPMELYRRRGVTAYVRGTPQQLIWQSYYVLRETLRYETPKAVVLSVNAMRYSEPVSEAYNRLTIDKMRWSSEKVGIIRASMTEGESFLSYVFPILRYHSRFNALTREDFTYLFTSRENTYSGYQMRTEVLPAGTLPAKRALESYDFAPVCWEYLEKIRALCEECGAELILMKAPSLYPYWYEEYDAQMAAYAAQHDLCFYNLVEAASAIGLDYASDTYDGGLHLNLSGATKLSAYFADILADGHGIPDRRTDAAVAPIYDEKLRRYDEAAKESEESS